MVKKGFVQRERVPWDTRKYRLSLTPKAKRIETPSMTEAQELNDRFYEGLSDDEIRSFQGLLGRILKNLEVIEG